MTVVAVVNSFQVIVLVDKPKGYLLLTSLEPIHIRLWYAQYLSLEKAFLFNDKTGRPDVAYELVPPVG